MKPHLPACLSLAIAAMTTMTTSRCAADFADDVSFLRQHTDVVLLERDGAAVAVAPAYQGRVMTSTIDAAHGVGFGWINRPVIEQGVLPPAERAGTLQAHIHVFGGEERFWLGPEGGQFALFFKPGDEFTFEEWQTPAAIDTEPFNLVEQASDWARFHRDCELVNYSGTVLTMAIDREVRLLDRPAAEKLTGGQLSPQLRLVGYQTDNRLTNRGDDAWAPEDGLPSIWLLGMFKPAPRTTVVIPFKTGPESQLGPAVNDAYFGKVPASHLRVEDGMLFFKGDGALRAKIGVSPQRSRGIAGSYDADSRVLTLVTYNEQDAPHGYVNSMWEIQEQPYAGDVINSYNDGSPAPGEPPLGPFYELETSSPAAALAPGETMRHLQTTLHLQGPADELDTVARRTLGVSLEEITSAF